MGKHMFLMPLPLTQRDVHMPNRKAPYGDHRSANSSAARIMHESKQDDGRFMHTAVCMFIAFPAGGGATRLCIERVRARGTVPATVALRVTA